MLPSTVERVPDNTTPEVNREIARQAENNVTAYARAGDEAIGRRLQELDREWDIERTLEANAASVALLGLGLGSMVDRRFYMLPAVVAGFLLQHALQGWCPPVPVFRRLGYRTQPEIEQERYALKALRGDFSELHGASTGPDADRATRALEAARR
jgi:hypothetical protein